jgi:hypothetical protein
MTDRELLENAAKAAGITRREGSGAFLLDDGSWTWNPLYDDGDALRLAVKLKLGVCVEDHYTWTDVGCNEDHGSDAYAATRRAIVRAAAALVNEATTFGPAAGARP